MPYDSSPKAPVVRGARACTTCRAAKMKCVGAEDGQKQCQRCRRANVECIFEKHRRGRKPGSKLSEASKMLRRLEKGLNSAKSKAASVDSSSFREDFSSPGEIDSRYIDDRGQHYSPTNGRFAANQLPPLNLTQYSGASEHTASSASSHTMDVNDDDDSPSDRAEDKDAIFPANLLQREHQRNSFFRTILNPEVSEAPPSGQSSVRGSETFTPPQTPAVPTGLSDPVSAGILDEEQAKVLFDLIFLRLNPFINLFDPSLHSVSYVRNKSPFLFTVLLMAGCKFFKAELFKQVQKLANEYAVKAFQEGWKSVEVVQAFACLTYWKDPDDNRTWTFIGYACRMGVELGLNCYVPHPPPNETEFQFLERRNRERTYLVLYVHDRSLATSTGRNWMLPEDDFIRHADRWHERPASTARPEDVIVAAFVQLRHIAAETTEVYRNHTGDFARRSADINYDVVLRNCNNQLNQWNETWNREMQRAGGDTFHFSFLSLFRLYIRLFTNSFGIQHSPNRAVLSVQALSTCYSSAVDSLKIVSKDFASMSVLRYGQETVMMMSAYAAVFLLRLLRNSNTLKQLHEGAAEEAYTVILSTADAYHEASVLSIASSSSAYHARFLKGLLTSTNDIFRFRKPEKSRSDDGSNSPDTRSQGGNICTCVID
ncbi:hypothetical protein GYMLUDRAFT_162284 [Collybiopsis luxurians FD-317 M1]|uniref:Zn(2)-C6 fungal-type domain-containing protein n=1 Tax=Collybiopsis luxurians FD-317 M1 TaxID=944289 RepID=A0A0D0CVT5_9AGAR|nr:hypothetical protein GYMLUDRAFT_162284 [Collybiopsis luxurians FD-317 M1]